MTSAPGNGGPEGADNDDPLPDLELSSGHSFVVVVVNALMAAMTFGALASMAMAFGRLLR